jgi:hypothetical protein
MALNQKLLMVLPYPYLPYLGLPSKEKDLHHRQIRVEALDRILRFLVALLLRVVLMVVILRVLVALLLVVYLLLKVYILNMRSY